MSGCVTDPDTPVGIAVHRDTPALQQRYLGWGEIGDTLHHFPLIQEASGSESVFDVIPR
jgi:hypothetical protein